MSIENARAVGVLKLGTQHPIEVCSITPTAIHYSCQICHCEAVSSIDTLDAEKTWYTFSCGTCENQRMVNLRKVLGIPEKPVVV